ncbi:MAG: hypothetical protein AAGB34_05245 [Planctomycetota bacterium]
MIAATGHLGNVQDEQIRVQLSLRELRIKDAAMAFRIASRIRRMIMIFLAIACVIAGFAMQFAENSPIDIRRAETHELLMLLGLLVLPLSTIVADRMLIRAKQRTASA